LAFLGCGFDWVFQDLVFLVFVRIIWIWGFFREISYWFFRILFVSFADTKMLKFGGDRKLFRPTYGLARRRSALPDERPTRGRTGVWGKDLAAWGGVGSCEGRAIKIEPPRCFRGGNSLSGPTIFSGLFWDHGWDQLDGFTFLFCPWHLPGFSDLDLKICFSVWIGFKCVFHYCLPRRLTDDRILNTGFSGFTGFSSDDWILDWIFSVF
jgi:hypothetical protein